jgi:hypothetical protein
LAIPRTDDFTFDRLSGKVDAFGTAPLEKGRPKEQEIANLEDLFLDEPEDRLAEELESDYENLIQKDFLIIEVEILVPLVQEKNKIKDAIGLHLKNLKQRLIFDNGALLDHDIQHNFCRAVIRCSGKFFQELVEDDKWQTVIFRFEPRPEFESFHETWKEFQFAKLNPIESPADDAPIVCVVDSGVSAGNPFLKPVKKTELLKSYLENEPENPADGNGHGSGVASLVSYYALSLAADTDNQPKVWIASARILDSENQFVEEQLFSNVLKDVGLPQVCATWSQNIQPLGE